MISLGFIQEHTKICTGPPIESTDRNVETAEKLRLYTIEIGFQNDTAIYPRYYILGHPEEAERDRWLLALQVLVERKMELQGGWQQYYKQNAVSEADKTEEWLKHRSGAVGAQLNLIARRKARLQNGKVLQDVPKVFDKFSEDVTEWSFDPNDRALWGHQPTKRFMDAPSIVPALAELGLDLAPKVSRRVLDEVRKNPPWPEVPNKVDLQRFELIFRSCCLEFLVSPSAEMKQNLMRIMQDSKNPFLSLLSPAEQMYLIEGQDSDGRYFCTCKSYGKDTVLVQQGDEGDSMFVIIEGNLSVVVTFGTGSSAMQKEVAVLPAGSVMGEMSLVLGKPRSATCVVKSESASVAEISKTAMVRLLETRPSLARELEDMVHKRDTANYLNAGKTADAMAAYRQRGAQKGGGGGVFGAVGGGGGGGDGGAVDLAPGRARSVAPSPGGGGDGGACSRPVSRIQSRLGKVARRPQSSASSLPGLQYRTGADVAAAAEAAAPKVKTGRWVKCRGVYVFVVD